MEKPKLGSTEYYRRQNIRLLDENDALAQQVLALKADLATERASNKAQARIIKDLQASKESATKTVDTALDLAQRTLERERARNAQLLREIAEKDREIRRLDNIVAPKLAKEIRAEFAPKKAKAS